MSALRLGAAAAALALAGCAPTAGMVRDATRIVHGADGRPIGIAALRVALRDADYVLLGEVHDNAIHHRLQEDLLADLAAHGSIALVMEPFDLEDQATLDAAAAVHGYADALGAAGRVFGRSWNWAFYRPLVEVALSRDSPVVAANLSRAHAREVAGKGFDVLPGVSVLALEAAWNDAHDADLAREIAASHCGMLPAARVPGMARAQRARDALMADRMLRYPRAVLVAGAGHARFDRGVPLYLRHRAPAARIVSVGFVEESPAAGRSASDFDYAWITAAAKRPDPCAAFAAP